MSLLRSTVDEHQALAYKALISLGKLASDQPYVFKNFLALRLFKRFCFLTGLKQIWNSVSKFQEFERARLFPFSIALFAFQAQASFWYILTSGKQVLLKEHRWITVASFGFLARLHHYLQHSQMEILCLSYLLVKLARDLTICKNALKPYRSWRSCYPQYLRLSTLRQVCLVHHC